MKILIASTIVPFVNGGSNIMNEWLMQKLQEYGHEANLVKIPFSSDYKEMLPQMIGLRLYHLEDLCDRLICIRMPSYLLKHDQKYLWFIHHYREIYDLWGTELDGIPKNDLSYSIREHMMRFDDMALKEAKKIYTNSFIISKRLEKYNGIIAPPVYPPLLHPEQYHCEGYGDFIYYSSRICPAKRQFLAIKAMKYTSTNVKLLITGKCEQDSYLDEITEFIKNNHLEEKIIIQNEWITEGQKAEYMAKCLCAIYIPFEEDSYGYPSLEAFHSSKAVISCTDSGGTDELIIHEKNGYLLEPDPQILAKTFDLLYDNKKIAEAMGQSCVQRINELDISWDHVIRRFTE